jgi:hypothetical protein
MVLATVRPKPFPGRAVQATPLPQVRRRAAGPVFSTSGLIGAVAEVSHTLSRLPQTRLTPRLLPRSIG